MVNDIQPTQHRPNTVHTLKNSTVKSTIEVAAATDLIPTLELIKRAVEAGELDTQIESANPFVVVSG